MYYPIARLVRHKESIYNTPIRVVSHCRICNPLTRALHLLPPMLYIWFLFCALYKVAVDLYGFAPWLMGFVLVTQHFLVCANLCRRYLIARYLLFTARLEALTLGTFPFVFTLTMVYHFHLFSFQRALTVFDKYGRYAQF